jgi:transcriptional regulator of acetoin/glycerol metabolism
LDEDLDEIRTLVKGLEKVSGNLSELAKEMGLSIETVRKKIKRYYLSPFRYELDKRVEEILIALGSSGGNLKQASGILKVSEKELEALIRIYALEDELANVKEMAKSLENSQGSVNNANLDRGNVKRAYLGSYIYQIKKEVDRILYALGISGGDLKKASQEFGCSLEEFENLVIKYNLDEDLKRIQEIVKALKETKGNINQAAELLEMPMNTLWVQIMRYYLKLTLEQIRSN